MTELALSEKLQPCLIDRLTDDEPDKEQESRSKRVMSMQKYRRAVIRDLTWLLNTHANADKSGYYEYSEIPSSVLNYGVQNVAGETSSSIGVDDIRYRLIETLRRFEPRILPDTVSIVITMDLGEMTYRSLQLEIRGDLWAEPIPESLFIKTELDLETGKSNLGWGSGG